MIDFEQLHTFSFMNEELIKQVKRCGCFYCLKMFNSSEIENWVKDGDTRTALCPYCCVDSVLPESNDGTYELNEELLKKMYKKFF